MLNRTTTVYLMHCAQRRKQKQLEHERASKTIRNKDGSRHQRNQLIHKAIKKVGEQE